MLMPRPHFSWYQLNLWETNRKRYIEEYFKDGLKLGINRGMGKGKQMADALAKNELSGDEILDTVIVRLPKFEIMDKPFLIKIPGKEIKLWGQPDTATATMDKFIEYKTSQTKWTKKMVDGFGQITFYACAIYLKTGKIPEYMALVDVRTFENEEGIIEATGEFNLIETTRSKLQIFEMLARINKACKEISNEYNRFLF